MTELYELTLTQAAAGLQHRDFSAAELTQSCLGRIAATEPDIHACLTVMGEAALAQAQALDKEGPDPARPLWGLPIAVKDLFCTQGVRTTAASKMLENYVPPYDACVVERLKAAGAIIAAKTNLDEFAMGAATTFSAFGPTRNPWDTAKVPGGSSGGAAASIAAYQTPGGFGTDTGGSIRQPASFCGCVGLKPTYGRVSRRGVVAFASSLDQPGPMARRVGDCARLLQAVAGPDPRDNTASVEPVPDYAAARPAEVKGLRLGLPTELWEANLAAEIKAPLTAGLKALEGAGAILAPVAMPNLKYSVATYYILACAEASTNLARYDGVRYGHRGSQSHELLDLYVSSRSEALGPEVRRRIILGTFALSSGYYDAYYKKAAQVRRLIRDDFNRALGGCDFLLTPITTVMPWDIGGTELDPLTAYQLDLMTLPVNLAGLPALSLPAGLAPQSRMPVGWQLIAQPFGEAGLFAAGLALEKMFPPLL